MAETDYEAVRNLLGRYARAVDLRDFETVGNCFTEDAIASYSGLTIPQGRENVVNHIKGVIRTVHSQHFNYAMTIDVDGDQARTLSYSIAVLIQEDGGGYQSLARGLTYTDKLRKTNGRWQIYNRLHTADWQWVLPAYMNPGGMWEVDPKDAQTSTIFRSVFDK
ncbi:MAG: nuclear transport factor 2 family protein [Actinobacteria bacterium]|nr:nuclear transport factor 2 family protein [Actinomycetota bacterium]